MWYFRMARRDDVVAWKVFFSGSAADSLNFFTAWKLFVEKYIKNPLKLAISDQLYVLPQMCL